MIKKSTRTVEDNLQFFDDLNTLVQSRLVSELAEAGIQDIPKPSFKEMEIDTLDEGEPILPSDITIISLAEVGKLYSAYNAWMNYLSPAMSKAHLEEEMWAEIRRWIWSTLRTDAIGTKDDKDDSVITDGRYIRVDAEYFLKKNKHTAIKNKCDQIERVLKFLSREITRRQAELELNQMDGSFEKRFKKSLYREGNHFQKKDLSSVGEETDDLKKGLLP